MLVGHKSKQSRFLIFDGYLHDFQPNWASFVLRDNYLTTKFECINNTLCVIVDFNDFMDRIHTQVFL